MCLCWKVNILFGEHTKKYFTVNYINSMFIMANLSRPNRFSNI